MNNKIISTKILIIGSGPAGYTAAIYAARANLKPHLVSGLQQGGQMNITTDVENYPGFGDVIQGPWLMEQMKTQAEKVGTVVYKDIINNVNLDSMPFVVNSDSGLQFNTKTIIISTGAQARWLNLKSEEKLNSKKDREIIQTLMGSDVAPRKDFIFSHALDVKNLDI